MTSNNARNTLLALLVAVFTMGAQADISEGRYTSFDATVHAPIPMAEVRLLEREDPLELEPVGVVEAQGKNDSEVDVLEQVNGLKLPGPLSFFSSNAAPSPNEDDAGLALHALKSVAARHGVQALLIIESERAQIRKNVMGYRIVAKAFRRKVRRDKLSLLAR